MLLPHVKLSVFVSTLKQADPKKRLPLMEDKMESIFRCSVGDVGTSYLHSPQTLFVQCQLKQAERHRLIQQGRKEQKRKEKHPDSNCNTVDSVA